MTRRTYVRIKDGGTEETREDDLPLFRFYIWLVKLWYEELKEAEVYSYTFWSHSLLAYLFVSQAEKKRGKDVRWVQRLVAGKREWSMPLRSISEDKKKEGLHFPFCSMLNRLHFFFFLRVEGSDRNSRLSLGMTIVISPLYIIIRTSIHWRLSKFSYSYTRWNGGPSLHIHKSAIDFGGEEFDPHTSCHHTRSWMSLF